MQQIYMYIAPFVVVLEFSHKIQYRCKPLNVYIKNLRCSDALSPLTIQKILKAGIYLLMKLGTNPWLIFIYSAKYARFPPRRKCVRIRWSILLLPRRLRNTDSAHCIYADLNLINKITAIWVWKLQFTLCDQANIEVNVKTAFSKPDHNPKYHIKLIQRIHYQI